MKNTIVSGRYAKALFELVQEKNLTDRIQEDLKLVTNTLDNYPDFVKLFFQPVVNKNDKKEMFKGIFKDKIADETLNFMLLLIDKQRETLIPEIAEEFENMVNKLHSKVVAKVFTAVEADANELNLLRRRLEGYLEKQVEMETYVDQSILGGVLVKIGDRVIDGTLKSRFENMARSLR